MNINQRIRGDHASYISNLYTIDCRLGTNPNGAPPLSDAIKETLLDDLSDYYSFNHIAKLSVLTANYIGTAPDRVFFSNGSMPMLSTIFSKLLGDNMTMLGLGPQFVDAVSEFIQLGGSYNALKYSPGMIPIFCEEIRTTAPSIVYIDNPNNPTGRAYSREELEPVVEACQDSDSILLIDEAYGDYLKKSESMAQFANEFNNVLVTRSFSKGLGLASCRLGYAVVSPNLRDYLSRIIIPFTPSLTSIKIACDVLPNIDSFLEKCKTDCREIKKTMIDELQQCGIEVLPTNDETPIFLAYKRGENLASWFDDRGILVESAHHFALTDSTLTKEYCRLRIVGNTHDLEHFIYRLK
ncbi:aminotransferase class I/II-fold pyridoxal phosphate-dependent enzyme [Vibrio sp. 10N.261.52.A1]|uniref:aminotransferase class I/II-fold pyridoxal phosphate-dependent enzyme n=1 Tax=Vibrio TaxID=662 RepID=UPI000C84A68A|nr:aminotransferase class I/II-fold pyridoxal phosphate-dependent enzyme [Vibrio sp. 10N.261.52.A1]PML42210.1 hypothetical protein BCT81_15640 [Vibrio sp. 10N.261.52.A1]